MFGIQTLITSGLSTLFTYIGIGTAIILVGYAIYRYFQYSRHKNQTNDFQALQNRRAQQVHQVRTYDATTTAALQQKTDEILDGIRCEQEQFGELIKDFARKLDAIKAVGEDLDQTNQRLGDNIITPLQTLLATMRQQYDAMSQKIFALAETLTTTSGIIIERERELASIVENLKEIKSSAEVGMTQLNSGLDTIVQIKNELARKTKRIQTLEKTNETLTQSLATLNQKVQKLLEANASKQRLIDLLSVSENIPLNLQQNRRATLSPNHRYSNTLFREGKVQVLHSSPSGSARYSPYAPQSNATRPSPYSSKKI